MQLIPEWYVRLRHDGKTRKIRLRTGDKDKAAEEAFALAKSLAVHGWAAVDKGMARAPASPTIAEFCEAYLKACEGMARPPRPISRASYTMRVRQVAALAGITHLRDLTPAAVERARGAYLAQARKTGRTQAAVANSLACILRNAAACFSREALRELAKVGVKIDANPFAGASKGGEIAPVRALAREIIERLWQDLPLLRDGDPGAHAPGTEKVSGRLPVDWRSGHRAAWGAVLLALGAGLRANEADKARWTWFRFDSEGRCFLEIRPERDFQPKGGTARTIMVPRELHDELAKARTDPQSPYVLGGRESETVARAGYGYRLPEQIRVASAWLRLHGVDDANPLHRLRKEFGSQVATTYGLFAAQKLLGHNSPVVTSKYYASLIDLPKLTHLRLA